MDIWSSIGGMVRVTLTSAEPEQALAEIAAQGVEMRNIHREDGLTYGFLLGRKALGSVEALCIKRGDTLTVRERKGIFWAARQLLYRPMLAFTMLFFFLAVLFLPGRIFFVRVEGNEIIPLFLIPDEIATNLTKDRWTLYFAFLMLGALIVTIIYDRRRK